MKTLVWRFAILVTAALVCGLLSLSIGARQDVGLVDLFMPMAGDEISLGQSIMRDIRLPRTLIAAFVGANLGLAGLVLQAITRNPLASPSILGVNQGAALGLAIGLVFPAAVIINIDINAIVGALVAGAITFSFASGGRAGFSSLRLILAGIAVGAFAFAMVRFTFVLEDDLARQVLQWTAGDISSVRWHNATPLMVWTSVGIACAMILAHRFNLLALGEAASKGLGANPRAIQIMGGVLAAILTGVSVVAAGPVMFVGLVMPHMCKRLFGHDHRLLVPAVVLAGALLMLIADIAAKLINFPYETPVGVVCALIGAPYFLYQTLNPRGPRL